MAPVLTEGRITECDERRNTHVAGGTILLVGLSPLTAAGISAALTDVADRVNIELVAEMGRALAS